MPVAFGTNALYILARNGLAQTADSQKLIHERLLPLIIKKQDFLHAEGLAMTVYALSEAKVWDEAAWSMLKDNISKHDFNYQMVKNTRWNPSKFTTLSGKEHLMESEISEFGRHLFFEGKHSHAI